LLPFFLPFYKLRFHAFSGLENLSAPVGHAYLNLEMYDEAALWFERAYEERDLAPTFFSSFIVPEDLPDHTALQNSLNKPELNELFAIRRKNMSLPKIP